MVMKPRIFLLAVGVLVVIFAIILTWFYLSEKNATSKISSFSECAENGYPVQESYPRRCMTPDGRSFTENIERPIGPPDAESPTHPLISVSSLRSGDTVMSPLTITGLARGYWFFEASFPVELRDAKGNILSIGIAQAQGDWMTEALVPFSVTFAFKNAQTQNGTIVFKKDNPSGLPENEDSFTLPVMIGVSN